LDSSFPAEKRISSPSACNGEIGRPGSRYKYTSAELGSSEDVRQKRKTGGARLGLPCPEKKKGDKGTRTRDAGGIIKEFCPRQKWGKGEDCCKD